MDFWNAITGKTGTDDDRGGIGRFEAQDALGEAFISSIWGISLYQPNPLQWPLRGLLLKRLVTAIWEVCRSSRPRRDSLSCTCAHPMLSAVSSPNLSSRGRQRSAAQRCDQCPLQLAEGRKRVQGDHPVTHAASAPFYWHKTWFYFGI